MPTYEIFGITEALAIDLQLDLFEEFQFEDNSYLDYFDEGGIE